MGLKSTSLFLGVMIASVSTAFALECESCRRDYESLRESLLQRDKTIGLLAENKRYLASLSSEDASKFLKVNSNVTVILKKLDTIRAQTDRVQERIAKNGCSECQLPSEPEKGGEK